MEAPIAPNGGMARGSSFDWPGAIESPNNQVFPIRHVDQWVRDANLWTGRRFGGIESTLFSFDEVK